MKKTCKDCVHVEVCEDITRHKLSPERAKEILPILRKSGKICDHFKGRARFDVIEKARQALEKFPKAVK